MPDTNAGMASSGVAPGSQLANDIASMSDQAKRLQATQGPAMQANTQQNLQAAFGGQGEIKALTERIADHHMRDEEIDPQADPQGYLAALSKRITKMEKLAEDAKVTTGNMKAAATYTQVAGILKQRLHAFQNDYEKKLNEEANLAGAMHKAALQNPQYRASFPAAVQATQPATQPQGGFVQGQ